MKKFDEKIDFDSVLFHGLTQYEGVERPKLSLQRLVNIIRANGILSRKKVKETYGMNNYKKWEKEYCRLNWNGEDYISVCRKDGKSKVCNSVAYRIFVENGVALILDNTILNKLEVNMTGQLEDGEIQVKDKIDLKYVLGITVPVLNPKNVAIHKKEVRHYTREETEEWCKSYYEGVIEQIYKILDHYNLDIPIYSINNGKIIKPLQEVLDEVYGKENLLNF